MSNLYLEIKKVNETNINNIMETNKVFWAFSQKQLEEGKEKIGIKENKELIAIGMGGFCPRINSDKLFEEMEKENKRYKKELKKLKEATEEAIRYELSNHECYYTGSIAEVVEKFRGVYTREEIKKVFNKFNK